MNWEEVGAIGQVLGSIAVFITLGYLSVQIRHTREELRRSLGQGRSEAIRSILMTHATDERLIRLTIKANAAFGGQPVPFVAEVAQRAELTLEEAAAVLAEQGAFWNYRLQVIPYVDELSSADRAAFEGMTRFAYGQPGIGRFFYEAFAKPSSHPDALRYIDNLLAQPG